MAFGAQLEQEPAVQVLRRSLERGRLSHAYLFAGGQSAALEAVAKHLAKALNCPQVKQAEGGWEPCGTCSTCRRIDAENHPDIQWVRPESKSRIITIEQIRDVMQTVQLKPTEAPWKVVCLGDADRLNPQAANAFLKTLEEPPPRSVIILLTTEPQRVLETLVSRCLRLTFSGSGIAAWDAQDEAWLGDFARIAAEGKGGITARYRLLGSLLERLTAVRSAAEEAVSARSPLQRYDDIEPRLKEKWEDELNAGIEAEYRRRRGDVLGLLEHWFRDIWIQSRGAGDVPASFPKLIDPARRVADRIGSERALHNLEGWEQLQGILHTNVQEALALEVGLLKLQL